jgi:hypothetical protein
MDNIQSVTNNTLVPGMTIPGQDLVDLAKSLGYGNLTTDVSQLTQGGAGTTQSLDTVVAEMTYSDNSFKFLDSMRVTQAGQVADEWIDNTDIGGTTYGAVATIDGSTEEGTGVYGRRTLRMKFFTYRGGISNVNLKSPNFLSALNTEDVKAVRRIKRTVSKLIWNGNSAIFGDEFDGFGAILSDPARGNYDGSHVADLFSGEYSGLDAGGFSNPADVEQAVNTLANIVARPENGSGQLTDLYMSVNARQTINAYKNFEARQILGTDGSGKSFNVGSVISGFTNPWAGDNQLTLINHDQYIDRDVDFKSAETRGDNVSPAILAAPTLMATAVSSAADSKFLTSNGFAGTYQYFAAVTIGKGKQSLTVTSAPQIVASGQVVTVTVTHAAVGDSVALFRSNRGGTTLAAARLIGYFARTGTSTVIVDKNQTLPGSNTMYLLNKADPEFMDWRQLFGFFRTELPTNPNAIFQIPFAIAMSGALRVKKPRHGAIIKNLIFKTDKWSPFTGNL